LAVSLHKSQISKLLCKLAIAQYSYITQANRSSWYLQPTVATNSLCLVADSKKWRCVIITFTVTICFSNLVDN
jgi:hypothetical protein